MSERAIAMLGAPSGRSSTRAASRGLDAAARGGARCSTSRSVAWLLDHGADVNARASTDRRRSIVARTAVKRRESRASSRPSRRSCCARGAELTPRSAVVLGDVDLLRARHARDADQSASTIRAGCSGSR